MLTANPDLPNAKGRLRIISVGRLEKQKGFENLVEAFALIADEYANWDVLILGEGPQRTQIEALIMRHGLEGRILLPGVATDVAGELARSHLMAFPSRYEGFPNALAEGLAAGLPAVGLKDVSGVEELIVEGKTGLLVEKGTEPDNLAQALAGLMKDGPRRKELGDAARKRVAEWAPDRVFAMWEELLTEAVRGDR
jgi:glycosyltransferase involved in cell wall biosynthesis